MIIFLIVILSPLLLVLLTIPLCMISPNLGWFNQAIVYKTRFGLDYEHDLFHSRRVIKKIYKNRLTGVKWKKEDGYYEKMD